MFFVSPDTQQEAIGVGSISIMSQADHVINVMINCRLAGGEQEIHKLGFLWARNGFDGVFE